MGRQLNPVAGAGAILLLIGVVLWLFVSMAIGIIVGVVGLVLVIVGLILSAATGAQKKCPYCSEYVQKNAVVCKHCGSNLAAQQSAVQPAIQPPQQAIVQPPVVNTTYGTPLDAVTTVPVRQANFCTGCGARIAPEESFCSNCGRKN